jgi:hypothetical protein
VVPLYIFLTGVVATGSLAIGVFFFRFWRRTGDRLFLAFAAAFVLMSANWAAQAFVALDESYYAAIYLLRLAAFLVIILGVVGKNRREASPLAPSRRPLRETSRPTIQIGRGPSTLRVGPDRGADLDLTERP